MSVAGAVLAPLLGFVKIESLRRRVSVEQELAIRRRAVNLPPAPWLPLHETGRDWLLTVGRLYDVPYDRLIGHAERLLDLFNLLDVADSPIRALSTGRRKKVALAGVLVADAPILMLDEPFAGGLDPSLGRLLGCGTTSHTKCSMRRLAACPKVLCCWDARSLVLSGRLRIRC